MIYDMIQLSTDGFRRGSSAYPNEGPVRMVRLSPYWIDRLPVTNADFSLFISAAGYSTHRFWSEAGWDFIHREAIKEPLYWNDDHWNQPNHPVTGVSWWEAMAYACFIGKTLPTEAQWEYAAGGGLRTYPWGDEYPDASRANYAPGCEPTELRRASTAVDAHPAGIAWSGCLDMAGNVGEWCLDAISTSYEWDTIGIDPVNTANVTAPRILRGGSGLHDEDALRCASRDYYSPGLRDNIVGFRCVINLFGDATP